MVTPSLNSKVLTFDEGLILKQILIDSLYNKINATHLTIGSLAAEDITIKRPSHSICSGWKGDEHASLRLRFAWTGG